MGRKTKTSEFKTKAKTSDAKTLKIRLEASHPWLRLSLDSGVARIWCEWHETKRVIFTG